MLTVKGYILNENNIPVTDAAVFVNQKLVLKSSGQTGFFTIAVQKNDTITLRKGKTRDQFIANDSFSGDTAIVFFQLVNPPVILEEITLNGNRVKKFDGEVNEHLIDYYVFPDKSHITLKSVNKDYFLEINEITGTKKRYPLAFTPSSVSVDCKGNFLIHSMDSIYEAWMDDKLHFSNVIPKWQFEGNIQNLVYCGDSIFMDENYGYLNRKYSLNYYDKDTSYNVFSSFDTLGYYSMYEQISLFKAKTNGNPRILDSIPLNYQYMVNSQNRATTCTAAQTLRNGQDFIAMQVASKLNIQSERVHLCVVTVDFSKGRLYVFSNTGKQIHTAAVEGKDLPESRMMRDPYTDKFYVTNPNKAMFSLSKLNIENGTIQEILNLREVSYPEKVRIFDNTLYFIAANSNGFKKVYSVDLEKYASIEQ
jgi:hypothetical protein